MKVLVARCVGGRPQPDTLVTGVRGCYRGTRLPVDGIVVVVGVGVGSV